MKDNLHRLMLCLAALELSGNDQRKLIDELRSMSLEEINLQVSNLRQRKQRHSVIEDKVKLQTYKNSSQNRDDSVGERVVQLLKKEAGLSTARAAEELAIRLTKGGLIKQNDVPLLSRKSLENWVSRVSQIVPAKEILMYATIVRNEYAHTPQRDWTLSKPE